VARILIVEDEKVINKLICKNLALVGHQCITAFDGEQALELFEQHAVDLVLLDVMLPGMDGFEIMEYLKTVPVIFLTSKSALADRLKGLRLGADDYITKPFEMLELQARIDAVLRRTQKAENVFTIGNIHVNMDERQIYEGDKPLDCTPKEFELLEILIKNRNIALSREKLIELVWGYDYVGDSRTIDVHIQKLRKKLSLESYIKTVYKIGYRLEVKS